MPDNPILRIGNIAVALASDIEEGRVDLTPEYLPFAAGAKPDITLRLRRGPVDTQSAKKIFDCPPIWTLYRRDNTKMIKLFAGQARIERTLVLPPSPQDAVIYFSPSADRFIDPFFGPTLELLMVHFLARGMGVILHACGIARSGRGILFIGESGAGKSTLAELWQLEPEIEVLSDDRIIVRKEGGALWMYGTPWHGTARFASPRRVPVGRLFFIRHGNENSLAETIAGQATANLLTCSFPPHWDHAGLGFTLDLFKELVARCPCRALSFRPDRSVVAFLGEEGGV
jgi:hypothetical protein